MTTQLDDKVDAAARKLQGFVNESRRAGGLRAKVGAAFEGDPAFLRKLKPSEIAARARGRSGPVQPAGGSLPSAPAPSSPGPARKERSGGPSPWLVVGAAFAVGVLAAKAIDWRGSAHPRT
jgi:hypothetical protein